MKIFINGATGFVGRHVVFELLKRGHGVIAGVRDVQRAREVLGVEVELLAMNSDSGDGGQFRLVTALERCDAIVTLAGCSIFKAATRSGLAECRRSRLDTSQAIVDALQQCSHRPRAWIATSAIGIYPSRSTAEVPEFEGDEVEFETTGPQPDGAVNSDRHDPGDALSHLCVDWERIAMQSEKFGTRVVRMRLGAVLGREGQAWRQLIRTALPKFGVVIGGGRQNFSWIHVRDVARIYADALHDDRFQGPVNVVAPDRVTQRQVVDQINHKFGKIGSVSVPLGIVRWMLGPAAKIVVEGASVRPGVLKRLGYQFSFRSFDRVLFELTNYDKVQFGSANGEGRDSDYLKGSSPRVVLRHECEVAAPVEEVFAFFSRPENLGTMTPPHLRFAIKPPVPIELGVNSKIDYRIYLGKIPMNWSSELEVWQSQKRFVDVQRKGPYACWYHEHLFEPTQEGGTRVTDTVFYSLPMWSLSRIIESWFVRKQLRDIFAFRADVMRERFGFVGELR